MADFTSTLTTAIVASIVSVLAFLGIVLVLALYWSRIVRRIAPNRFAEPMSEKSWPSSRGSDTNSAMPAASARSSPIPSPTSSPRSSTITNDPMLPKAVLKK
ncbi:hypothetical protein E0Z10_g5055 [Xylaria hypoxylon]|uniref:Uncharacterized protein n=1 Tax=Xylaria hypoxylon TaxID=37992 RepID=A0A4Z0YWV8_9PEZI|nr:hypothetical protein E0Z10_g5055 [Xylaria hypoxylon]